MIRTSKIGTLASDIIARLELNPHPEGGHYRETFRDTRLDTDGRAHSTAIYFLLARGERSHWHRIDAVRSGIITRAIHWFCRSRMMPAGATSRWVPIWPRERCRRRSCRHTPGSRPKAKATGRWPAARSRLDLILQNSNSRQRAGNRGSKDPHRFRNRSLAAINPPPAISTAAIAMLALALAKPAMIRNDVESSGVA